MLPSLRRFRRTPRGVQAPGGAIQLTLASLIALVVLVAGVAAAVAVVMTRGMWNESLGEIRRLTVQAAHALGLNLVVIERT